MVDAITCSFSSTTYDSPRWMQVSAADNPPGPEPTIATSTTLSSPPSAPGRIPAASMCSTTARPRFAAFLTSGLPATSPVRYCPGTAGWKFSSLSGAFTAGRRSPLGEHHQRLGRAREHARLALDAVVEPEHAALVLDQVQHVRGTHRDTGIAARAAVIIDVVNQDARAYRGGRRKDRAVALAGGQHREHRHQEDGEAPERQRDDPGHGTRIPDLALIARGVLDVVYQEFTYLRHQVGHVTPGDLDRPGDLDTHRLAGPHHLAARRQNVDRTADRDRHDRRAGAEREVEPALLQLADAAVDRAGALGRQVDAHTVAQQPRRVLDRLYRAGVVRAVDLDELGRAQAPAPQRNAKQLGLGEHADRRRWQRCIQQRDIERALMVRHVDDGALWNVLGTAGGQLDVEQLHDPAAAIVSYVISLAHT